MSDSRERREKAENSFFEREEFKGENPNSNAKDKLQPEYWTGGPSYRERRHRVGNPDVSESGARDD